MKKFLTFLFAFCIFATAFAVSTPALAHADERTPLTGGVYYFTDNPYSYTIATYLEANTSNTSNSGNNFYYVPYTVNQYSKMHIDNVFLSGDYQLITDAYVIFECYYEFEYPINDSLFDLTYYLRELKTMFRTMKNNGCEIMFVCATDQNRYKNYTGFLQYVDIHVDTDIFYTCLMSAFKRTVDYYSLSNFVNGYTLFINEGMLNYPIVPTGIMDSYIFKRFIEMKLIASYPTEISAALNGIVDILNINSQYYQGFRIFCNNPLSGGEYNDCFCNDTEYISQLTVDNPSFMVANLNTQQATAAYVNGLLSDRQTYGYDFPIFFFNRYAFSVNTDGYDTTDYVYGIGPYTTIPSLQTIMLDFIDAEDISVYDNWYGRCDITHKLSVGDGEGWLEDIYDEDLLYTLDDEVEE